MNAEQNAKAPGVVNVPGDFNKYGDESRTMANPQTVRIGGGFAVATNGRSLAACRTHGDPAAAEGVIELPAKSIRSLSQVMPRADGTADIRRGKKTERIVPDEDTRWSPGLRDGAARVVRNAIDFAGDTVAVRIDLAELVKVAAVVASGGYVTLRVSRGTRVPVIVTGEHGAGLVQPLDLDDEEHSAPGLAMLRELADHFADRGAVPEDAGPI